VIAVSRRIGRWLPIVVAAAGTVVLAVVTSAQDPFGTGGRLRVLASSDEDPAWFSMAGGEAPGFEREVLEGFVRLHKLRLEIVPVTRWEDAIPMLREGKGDVLVGVNATRERRRLVDFTAELLPARNVVLTRRPKPPIESLEALRGVRVAVVPDTTWAEAVRDAGVPAAQTVSVEDVPAAIEALRSGKAGAAVTDVLDFLLQRRRDEALEMGLTLGSALSSAWAVRKGDSRLRESLDAYLARLRSSANWSRLLVKYFGDDAPVALGHEEAR
jgi:ABC-type amino acid transport substrate-binding protein